MAGEQQRSKSPQSRLMADDQDGVPGIWPPAGSNKIRYSGTRPQSANCFERQSKGGNGLLASDCWTHQYSQFLGVMGPDPSGHTSGLLLSPGRECPLHIVFAIFGLGMTPEQQIHCFSFLVDRKLAPGVFQRRFQGFRWASQVSRLSGSSSTSRAWRPAIQPRMGPW